MFLRATKRFKDGKVHLYWNMVENVRVGRRVFQRRALYLGERVLPCGGLPRMARHVGCAAKMAAFPVRVENRIDLFCHYFGNLN